MLFSTFHPVVRLTYFTIAKPVFFLPKKAQEENGKKKNHPPAVSDPLLLLFFSIISADMRNWKSRALLADAACSPVVKASNAGANYGAWSTAAAAYED